MGASSLAFGQMATTDLKTSDKHFENSNNLVSNHNSNFDNRVAYSAIAKDTDYTKALFAGQNSTNILNNNLGESELSVSYESKKLKRAQVYSSDGKLLQTSTKSLLNEKRLTAGEYLIKIDFQDGTSTSTKFIKK